MALLSASEQRALRRLLENKANDGGKAIRYTKPALHAVLQAIEDHMATLASGISGEIDSAATTMGLTFTAAEKKAMFAYWAKMKFERDR